LLELSDAPDVALVLPVIEPGPHSRFELALACLDATRKRLKDLQMKG